MYDKQEIYDAFCAYCINPVGDEPLEKWMADIKLEICTEQFEYYYEFFKEYIQQQSPSSM